MKSFDKVENRSKLDKLASELNKKKLLISEDIKKIMNYKESAI